MLKVIAKNIIIARGDTGSAMLELVNVDGTPFILPTSMNNPFFAFIVAKRATALDLTGQTLLIEKYMQVLDYSTKYQFSADILQFTSFAAMDTTHVYKKPGNTYWYKASAEAVAETEYKFIVTLTFDPGDTMDLVPGTFVYCLLLADTSVNDTLDNDNLSNALSAIIFKDSISVGAFTVTESAYV